MKGEDWGIKFDDYITKAKDGRWIKQHWYDHRNRDPVKDRIHLDTESRETIEYLRALIKMTDDMRMEGGLSSLTLQENSKSGSKRN